MDFSQYDKSDSIMRGKNVIVLQNLDSLDSKKILIELSTASSSNFDYPEGELEQYDNLDLTAKVVQACLAPEDCIPLVDKVSCLCLDITKNYEVTVDGQSITGTFEEVVTFLDSHGLYAYPGETTCNPDPPISCEGATDELHLLTTTFGGVDYLYWEFKILDLDTDEVLTEFTNLDFGDADDFTILCNRFNIPDSPLIFTTDEPTAATIIKNVSTSNRKFKLIGNKLVEDDVDFGIEILRVGGTPTYLWITEDWPNHYELHACLAPYVPPAGGSDDEDGVLYDALKSLTIEAFYIEDSNISLLKPEYQNLNGMTGHICNRSQFGMRINGLNVGFLNMNNDRVGEAFPLNNDFNIPAAISQTGTWAGMSAARYSRIDISEEQAYTLAALNNGSSLEICLARLLSNPHTGITWVRFSIRTSNGGLLKLYDQLISLGRYYTFDILNPQLGITESNIPVINPQNLMTYISNVKVKYGSDNNFKSLPSLVAINPTINADIDFDIEVEDPSLNQSLTVIYQLQDSYPDMTMVDGRLSVHSSANFSNRLVVINVTVTSSIDALNVIIQSIPVMITALQIDLDASILYCQNGVWKTLETGTTIPNGTLQAMSGVSEIIMSDKVTDIGDDCFSVSSNSQVAWTKMKLSANLKTIGQSSLQSLGSLTTLVLPEGLLTIGNHSVQRLGGTLVIPQSLKVIPDGFLYQWNPKTYTINLSQTTLTTIRDGFEDLQPANNGRYNILLPDSLLEFSGFRYMLVGKVQFGRNIQTIRQSAFGQSYDNFGSYVKVGEITILRADAMVEPLGVSPMGSIGFHADRKLKVPFALVDTYKGSAQWAKLVSNENIIGIDPDTYE